MAEYRLEELARQANTTVRNIRAYRDRDLLPAPRRAGRVAIYSDAHLGRLRLIADLLDRGYTLANIAELIVAWEHGKNVADVLGLEAVLAQQWSDEPSAAATRAEIEALLGRPISDQMLRDTITVGLLEVLPEATDEPGDAVTQNARPEKPGGGPATATADAPARSEVSGAPDQVFRVLSPSQLAAGNELVEAGVPLEEVLQLALRVHDQIDEIASSFVDLISRHLFDPHGQLPPADAVAGLSLSVDRLRPVARAVVNAELARAMERQVQHQLGDRIGRLQRS